MLECDSIAKRVAQKLEAQQSQLKAFNFDESTFLETSIVDERDLESECL